MRIPVINQSNNVSTRHTTRYIYIYKEYIWYDGDIIYDRMTKQPNKRNFENLGKIQVNKIKII